MSKPPHELERGKMYRRYRRLMTEVAVGIGG